MYKNKYIRYKQNYLLLKKINDSFNNKNIYYIRLPKNINNTIKNCIYHKLKNHDQFMHVIYI